MPPPHNLNSKQFRKRYYPNCSCDQWNSWHWQFANTIHTAETLHTILPLTDSEIQFFNQSSGRHFPFSVTPYYLSLINPDFPDDPLRRCVIPTVHEFDHVQGEMIDPLGEEEHSPAPGLIHRYPDRAVLLVNKNCPTYCRYCTRGRLVGRSLTLSKEHIEQALTYIHHTPNIHDVLISGGEPLLLADEELDILLGRLSAMPHLDYIRIGTKAPAVLPQRITPSLCATLKKHQPLYISLHATHVNEVSPEMTSACNMLADAGIPLGSQTVLLKGVNNSAEVLTDLFRAMIRIRVKPYYLLLCDPIEGSGHFRISVDQGIDILRSLQGRLSGYAIPKLILDIPGGGGKIPLVPDYLYGQDDESYLLTNYQGISGFRYPKR